MLPKVKKEPRVLPDPVPPPPPVPMPILDPVPEPPVPVKDIIVYTPEISQGLEPYDTKPLRLQPEQDQNKVLEIPKEPAIFTVRVIMKAKEP